MTEEAIERTRLMILNVEEHVKLYDEAFVNEADIEATKVVLAELEKYKMLYGKALEDVTKTSKKCMDKDKIIDLMTQQIAYFGERLGIDKFVYEEKIKKYFEKKAREV